MGTWGGGKELFWMLGGGSGTGGRNDGWVTASKDGRWGEHMNAMESDIQMVTAHLRR